MDTTPVRCLIHAGDQIAHLLHRVRCHSAASNHCTNNLFSSLCFVAEVHCTCGLDSQLGPSREPLVVHDITYKVDEGATVYRVRSIYMLHGRCTFDASCMLQLAFTERQTMDHFLGPVGLRGVNALRCRFIGPCLSMDVRIVCV